eukprot:3177450-Pleurochrysis_carterae.AAC.1
MVVSGLSTTAPAARRAAAPPSAFTADMRATAPAGRSRKVRGWLSAGAAWLIVLCGAAGCCAAQDAAI